MKAWWRRLNYRRYVFDFTTGKASPIMTPREWALFMVLLGFCMGHGLMAVLKAL